MNDTSTDRVAAAREHLARAETQRDEAATAAWEPPEPADCVSKCFYAFENAVVAAAIALGIPWEKNHWRKAELAAKLYKTGNLTTDISERLLDLNGARKDISYGDPGPVLAETDLEDLVSDLDDYLIQVTSIVDAVEEPD